jgi:hypothetical protein
MSGLAADQPDPTLGPDSAWLAAYALGLAYSSRTHQQRVNLLRDATRSRPELLAVAEQRLAVAEVVEPALRAQARRLLEGARASSLTGA